MRGLPLPRMFLAAVCLACEFCGAQAAVQTERGELLRFVIMSRHGVRSPTGSPETLARWTVSKWPDFKVPPGHLTPRGGELAQQMGGYYRDHLAAQGLFPPAGCPAGPQVFLWADVDQRTQATGSRIMAGFAPDCPITMRKASESPDPIFHPVEAGVCRFNADMARAAVMGRIGGDFAAVESANRDAMKTLQDVLRCCTPKLCDKSFGGPGGPCTLPTLPTRLKADPKKVSLEGGLAVASTFAEILLLEHSNGFRGRDFGFGRADLEKMRRGFAVHTLAFDIVQRTPYIARRQGAMLLRKLTAALAAGHLAPPPGASDASSGEARFVAYIGHDTNIANLAAMLGVSWQQPGYQMNQTPPGGALAFELRRGRDGRLRVYSSYVAQSLKQLGDAEPLSLNNPPQRSALFIPACSSGDDGYPCLLEDFVKAAGQAMAPDCLR